MLVSQFLVFFVLIVLSQLKRSIQDCEESLTVTIFQGTLRGRRNATVQGTEYSMFLGIPYARPPVGRLRFVAPQPLRRWSGVREAGDFGSMCCQMGDDNKVFVGSEDCLFVNVFTPKCAGERTATSVNLSEASRTELEQVFHLIAHAHALGVKSCVSAFSVKMETALIGSTAVALCQFNVMVWIHGGGFASGSGNTYPGHLLDHGLVIVSFNYRLNVFGFLSVEGTDAPGNAGLKDQTAVLRWVRRNIAHFGGNPHAVTIFGASAGGACVHYHMLSPLSRGLFRRGISQSGSALNPWAFSCSTQDRAHYLSHIVGRPANSSRVLVANLRATPAKDLTRVLSEVIPIATSDLHLLFAFPPTMEYRRSSERPFLPQSPECIESSGSLFKVPYILGVTLKEAALFMPETLLSQPWYWQDINGDLEQIVPVDLGLRRGSRSSSEVARKIKEFYFGDETISYENRHWWVDLQSDLHFILGVQVALWSHARFSDVTKTYNYQYVYNNATHVDELKYVFYSGQIAEGNTNESMLAEHFASLWTSFAKEGVPTTGSDVPWPPVSKSKLPFLQISTSLRLEKNLENDKIHFWSHIYRNYRQSGTCCSLNIR